MSDTVEVIVPPGGESCPACSGAQLRPAPPSRVTGLVIQACPRCGLHALADRDTVVKTLAYEEDFDRQAYAAYMAVTRTEVLDESYREVLDRLSVLVRSGGSRTLFDVGAGDGAFLARAQGAGFEPHGNELAPGAIDLAREERGIELLMGDLSGHPDAGPYDVLTMWCVLAHVPDGAAMLRDVHRVLAPGGVLYMQTPRWSLMDRAALAVHRLSRGRMTRITDRRMAAHHMTLHSRRSISELLARTGFDVVTVQARARYSLTTTMYLQSLRVPPFASRLFGGLVDRAIDRGLFFRNVLDVYARRSD